MGGIKDTENTKDIFRLFAHEVLKYVAVQTHTDFSKHLEPVLERYSKDYKISKNNSMAEIADMMLTGIMCAMCGTPLECDICEDGGIPMYCSLSCAKDQGADKHQVCNHD